MTPGPVVPKFDRVGLALVALLIVWVGIAALVSGRSPRGTILTIVLTAVAFALGRAATRFLPPWVLPATVLVFAYAVFLESPGGTFSLSVQGFLGYANAKAAFFVQAAFATAMIVAAVRSPVVAVISLPAIALFALIPVYSRSLGGFLSSLILVPALFVALVARWRRAAIVLAAVLAFGAIGTSLFLAREFADDRHSALEDRFAELLDRGRAALWADSYRLVREYPGFGVGPGGFAEQSPTAAAERDLRWAHNEFLQQAAETGLPGLVFLAALLAWLLWGLWRANTTPAAVAAFAISSLVAHACADYLFHFPLLPAMTVALAGSATSSERQWDRAAVSTGG